MRKRATIAAMRFSLHQFRWIARLVLAALVLAHAIQFAQACALDAQRPAMAFAADHCKTPDQQAPMSANACLNQCLQPDQSSTAEAGLPPAPNVVALVLPVERIGQSLRSVVTTSEAVFDSSPPLTIRFCSLQL